MRIITPEGYEPDSEVLKIAREVGSQTGANIEAVHSLEATEGADVLYTDVWASMGQEKEAEARKAIFADYRIDATTMERADDDAVILHCLPAHYGDEIDYATSRTPNSALFDQAENRMHAQKALVLLVSGCSR